MPRLPVLSGEELVKALGLDIGEGIVVRYREETGDISLDFLKLYSYNYSDMAKLRNRIAEAGSNPVR